MIKSRDLQDFCYTCCILPESYSEVDIVLDEDGRRNVVWKAVIHSEVLDLLKVLHEWFLEEESMHVVAQANFLLGILSLLSTRPGVVDITWHVV